MRNKFNIVALSVSAILLSGCGQKSTTTESTKAESQTAVESVAASLSADEQASAFFEKVFNESVMRSPMTQSFLGIKEDQDKWDDLSDAFALETLEIAKANLQEMDKIDTSALSPQVLVSYTMMKQNLEQEIEDFKWRDHNYPVNQMFGIHSRVPALLINQHPISSEDDALDYISRINKVDELLDQVIDGLKSRADKGIIAPKFVYPYVISDSKNVIKGAPFDDGDDSTLLADFKSKIKDLDIADDKKSLLVEKVSEALLSSFGPGYVKLIDTLNLLEKRADTNDGVWKFPEGSEFYNVRLARMTTTDKTAADIHEIGLSEVARIHNEMRVIMKKVGFEGSLQEFFNFMRFDEQFFYGETAEGKQRYLSEATAIIEDMKGRLDELFLVKPKAELTVKAVEAFREKSAGKAFYQRPSQDGTRPGIYYANLYRMSDMPVYQMEALAYHEGIPGHHMQLAIAQELRGIPKFRKFGGYTAYIEGWGLYSEYLPKEIGLYEDPYSDFGRLAMELWRACRLVVDTGIHEMKWTREEGIDYYVNNTPNPKPDAVKMVERHVVMAGQATAYKIGMLKILELREKAQLALGDKFDIREYHDVVLKNGAVPLNILEDFVDEYISSKG
ncbi:DUF885 domain-containing protein [Alteromonas sp. 5E99-2]|uniref:DUF885 domain-containing protein n=1 Tax=Alteromonas sp. 5E99-2 TaxID=2817683 RepID=UPI001A97F4C4|nr:DUF885 domain-containing protein [Alteromonas sp. 5E99-2]MBO1255201.1 DUF885 domain-containing protein [Alteromonas sp. 5E99-2]